MKKEIEWGRTAWHLTGVSLKGDCGPKRVQTCAPCTFILLRGAILNRTYGTYKNLPGIYLAICTNNIWSYLLWSPVIVVELFMLVAFILAFCQFWFRLFYEERNWGRSMHPKKRSLYFWIPFFFESTRCLLTFYCGTVVSYIWSYRSFLAGSALLELTIKCSTPLFRLSVCQKTHKQKERRLVPVLDTRNYVPLRGTIVNRTKEC